MDETKVISPLIKYQFPDFVNEYGPNFIAFVQAYYEWMEQPNHYTYESRRLFENGDIDLVENQFLVYFKDQYINSLPETIAADKRLLVKHILDLYRSKGTPRAYSLLFRLLFNEDIELYIPNNFLLKPSDGTWVVPQYIETTGNPYLVNLVGNSIYNSSLSATAIVESVYQKVEQNRVINVIYLSSITGIFKFGETIFSTAVPEITEENAPVITGSLTTASIVNGGANFNIGDVLTVKGNGSGGLVRVVSTQNQNGKVSFNLLNGGFGFSMNAQITVSGGGGTGASFKIGSLVNKETYVLNTDVINTYYNTQLDITSEGFVIDFANASGTFSDGANVTSSANVVVIDCEPLSTTFVTNGEFLSNTSLGISNLLAFRADQNLIYLTSSTDSQLTNANLVNGVILESSATGSLVKVNQIWTKSTWTATGNLSSQNTSSFTINNVNGYFVNTATISQGTNTAVINSVIRQTNWMFPTTGAGGILDNLDTPINLVLTTEILEVGTISSLNDINPGVGYTSNPNVSIIEPLIYDLLIPDGFGGYKGFDADITAIASNANGIVTAVERADSGFGFIPGETLTLESTNSNNPTVVTAIAVIDQQGVATGYWKDNKGFVSDINYLQDSYFYQSFSYQILAKRMLNTYEKLVKDLVHPSGMALFGMYQLKEEVDSDVSVISQEIITQS